MGWRSDEAGAIDFVPECPASDRPSRMLNVVGLASRDCVVIEVDPSRARGSCAYSSSVGRCMVGRSRSARTHGMQRLVPARAGMWHTRSITSRMDDTRAGMRLLCAAPV